jgi:[glutamine synthetase] adenylyltransferase / [glutamine synthetase]-adenylyl-L-tyrosine phosphorylase
MVHDLQTHALPEAGDELERVAVRVGYDADDRAHGAAEFRADHDRHANMVNQMFRSFFHEPATSPILKAALRLCRAKEGS